MYVCMYRNLYFKLYKIIQYFIIFIFFSGEIVNEALNTNEEELFRIVKPYAEQKAKEVLIEIINKIGKNFSLNEIFPA